MNEFGSEIKSLIIIPDGLLGYLPFEVLIQSKESKGVYLNDKISIHYANSATYLIEQMQRKPSDAQNFFAGFVSSGSVLIPDEVVTRDQQYASLQGAEHEVASITELFNSGFTIFDPANKNDFINKASDYKILHFAMHSSLNDKNPMMSVMVFAEVDATENLLTAIELYSMKLNSDLAVLSACNTGVGQLHRGEGIMSFSRAFAYAGVPSAVISLWKVPDIATSKIMVSFYSHLKNGEPKDKALQFARQDFVRDNPEMAHPFYWSGFILTGNAEAIIFPKSTAWIWTLSLLTLAVLGTLYVRRKKLKASESK
jgi:CHAT domain-containing protein